MNEKPWLKHYDQGVPHSLKPYPQKTLLDVVNETLLTTPQIIRPCFSKVR